MIVCDFYVMRNKISYRSMVHDTTFHHRTINHRVAQYNTNNGSNQKLDPTNWKPNLPFTQHCHQHIPHPGIPKTKCTNPSSPEQRKFLYLFLFELLLKNSNIHQDPIHVHHENDDIDTILQT